MMAASKWIVLCSALQGVWALPQAVSPSSTSTSSSTSSAATTSSPGIQSTVALVTTPVTSVSSQTVTTAVPSPSLDPNSTLPSQAPLPPKQAWCPSEIYCAGALLQTVELAHLYPDSKTFVDKPTVNTSNVTLENFNALGSNPTIGAISQFVQTNFKGEGQELKPLALNDTNVPAFLEQNSTIPDPLARAWAGVVDSYWKDLIRDTDETTLCTRTANGSAPCESSLIPLNHTFVVPGGRFREQYYWDSFWIVEGLLKSELYDIVNSTLQNFMDELEQFGFIPNGGRIYYLNRSQPPLFIHMLSRYVSVTKDYSILRRALPLADAEMEWWMNNRAVRVTSPYTNSSYTIHHYAVANTAPRPESYAEDYETANGSDLTTPYTEEQKANLYAELASGAESGWDYTARWSREPWSNQGNTTNQEPILRTLNVRGTGAVDLNSILYKAMLLLADLHDSYKTEMQRIIKKRHTSLSATKTTTFSASLPIATGSDITRTFNPTSTDSAIPSPTTTSGSKPALYRQSAAQLKAAILDLMWDSSKLSFYDYNITSNSRSGFYSAAAFYPMWNDIWPEEVLADEQKAMSMFASVGVVLAKYNGTYPSTFLTTGMQWDAPNTWPPHQYIVLQALSNVPSNVSTQPYPQLSSSTTSFSLVPPYQLGLEESQLPVQTDAATGSSMGGGDVNYVNGTWIDGGVPAANETWNEALRRGLVNRYFTSVFCSWYSTGGSIPGLLPQLSAEELNATHSDPSSTGHMYEKLNLLDIDAAGSGGEYTVQAGFGWTNGVILWAAAELGHVIAEPKCPAIQITQSTIAVPSFYSPKGFYKDGSGSINVAGTVNKPSTFYKAKRATRPDGSYIL